MLVLKCKIIINCKDSKKTVKFDYVSSVEVVTSCKDLTDTATITVPRKIKWREKTLSDFIHRGDKISVELGYDGYAIQTVFTGYIKNFTSRTPITITCENEMYALKQIQVKAKRYAKFDFEAFMKEYAPDVEVIIPADNTLNFGEVVIKNDSTVATVLNQLKNGNPFYTFFRGGKLYSVMGQSALDKSDEVKTITFEAGKNIIDSKNIKYTLADDVNVRVKAISILANNTRIEAEAPKENKGGELRTFHNSRLKTKEELQKYAGQMLAELKVDRAEGSFTAFGIPFLRKGDRVKLIDKINTDIDGKILRIDAVKYTFNTGGYRQTVTLGDEYHMK